MGDNIDHYLLDHNHLRYYETKVNDNPMSDDPLSIIKEDNVFFMELAMDGTIVYVKTHYPTGNKLQTCPHIILSSTHKRNPNIVWFQ